MRMQVIEQLRVFLKKINYDLTVEAFLSALQITNDSDYLLLIKAVLQAKAKAQAKQTNVERMYSVFMDSSNE